ncbi:unnamed protein product [Durusdinium trenchii]|uniref:Uncharacterized protein n=1 Tax=Durusdinium trenchii TaxID=1381693 RepID=A0ABP0L6W8_9DINO
MAGAWRVRKNDVVAQQRHYQQGEGDTLEDAIHAVCKQDRLKRSEVVMTCIDLRISKKRSPKDLATVSKLKAVLQIPVLSNGGLTASSMLTGAVGSEEAEEGTQRLLTDLRDRARGRYILEWWRLQQAGSWSCEARGSTTR